MAWQAWQIWAGHVFTKVPRGFDQGTNDINGLVFTVTVFPFEKTELMLHDLFTLLKLRSTLLIPSREMYYNVFINVLQY